jgi:two-component system repressor protein LuxO
MQEEFVKKNRSFFLIAFLNINIILSVMIEKQEKSSYSTILHIGERNSQIIDTAIGAHTDLKCVHIADHAELLSLLQEIVPDLLIIEYCKKHDDFISYLSLVQRHSSAPIIITAKCPQCNIMVQAIKNGADNFLPEPLSTATLMEAIFEALRLRVLWKEVHYLQESNRSFMGNIIGAAPSMQILYRTIENVCKTEATVFIVGASGTGKELVARAIHENGPRGQQPFIAINCGAIPPNLLESELFGHERGAFTGAVGKRIGKFEQATNTTLFLDELCEMPIELQVKLLRVIQEKTLTRVGGKDEIAVNPRIICATNKDPLEQVKAGLFREDLYYRLNVVPIKIPPLTERRQDIPLLCANFLHVFTEKYGKYFYEFSPDALRKLCSYDWPGNVRELENILERIVVLHDGSTVLEQFLPEEIINAPLLPVNLKPEEGNTSALPGTRTAKPLWQMEMEMIKQALTETSGNVIKASAILEIGQASLYRKLKRYHITRSDYT